MNAETPASLWPKGGRGLAGEPEVTVVSLWEQCLQAERMQVGGAPELSKAAAGRLASISLHPRRPCCPTAVGTTPGQASRQGEWPHERRSSSSAMRPGSSCTR